MKFIVAFVLVVSCIVVNAELSKEFKDKVKAKVMDVGMKCAEKEGASSADKAAIMGRKTPTSKEGKCMISCFAQSFGMQDASGKYTKEGIMKALEPYKAQDAALYDKFMKVVVDTCLPEVKAADRCDAAAEFDACYHKNIDDDLKKQDAISVI